MHTDDLAQRARRIEILRDRFVAVSMRSRTLRLGKTSRSAAFDLSRVMRHDAASWQGLVDVLGHEEGKSASLIGVKEQDSDATIMASDLSVLYSAALTERVESGADTLSVGWPFLRGVAADGTWFRAPLFIYPVELSKTTSGKLVWEVTTSGPPMLNDALVQTLARLFGIKWSLDDFIEQDTDGVIAPDAETWRDLLVTLRSQHLPLGESQREDAALRALTRWTRDERAEVPRGTLELCSHAILGRFPLAATSVILDYHELLEGGVEAERLGTALHLLNVDEQQFSAPFVSSEEQGPADESKLPSNWRPFLSDSSQDAVVAHLDGSPRYHGVVVQGPPGTGKSQLIANLLCEVLARGQTALVVCQKRAALDVVATRLGVLGLREALGVVHDVRRDRQDFCQRLATTLAPLLDVDASQRKLERYRQASAQKAHTKAVDEVTSRLERSIDSWRIHSGYGADRPGLAELDERALDDPGTSYPELERFASHISDEQFERELLDIEPLVRRAAPFAAPHPWIQRGTLAGMDDEGIGELRDAMRKLEQATSELSWRDAHATMTAVESREHKRVWERAEALLELLEREHEQELDDFALFWTWCDGEEQGGMWRAITERLKRARQELSPVPWSLVLCSEAELREWIVLLSELKVLNGKWWRFFAPRYWKLKNTPQEVLEVVEKTQGYEGVTQPGQTLPVDLVGLCEGAIKWQALIAELPEDNAFFDFGFQGDPEQLDEALDAVKVQVELVAQVHLVQREMRAHDPVYDVLPEVWSVLAAGMRDLPFFAALRSDARGEQLAREVAWTLSSVEHAFGEPWMKQCIEESERGQTATTHRRIKALNARLDDLVALRDLDDVLTQHADFVSYFLRYFEGDPGQSITGLRWSVERAWRAEWAVRGGGAQQVRELIEQDTHLLALRDAVDARRAHAADALLARYRSGLSTLCDDDISRRALQQLLTQSRKQRYRLSLRQMVEQFWSRGLSAACPVWLCSPDSVSSLFPLEVGLFDVVIFDEASQCPVESAVGAMVRGVRVMIAGDDQQMPPSHFFASSGQDFEDEEVEEESLLASDSLIEASRQSFEHVTLRWHYRSRHEELIAFSNTAFYGSKLKTAPGSMLGNAQAEDEGLVMHRVHDGLWAEQRNEIEAGEVVNKIKHFMSFPDPPSLGVVTFNLKQAECIELALAREVSSNESFAMAFEHDRARPATERLFVRNLENVQGDERDVMIMSVGYAPTEPGGRVKARFGPLGQEGGERRLNVAITRARQAYVVMCSFDPEELDVAQSKNLGPKLFKEFLCYTDAMSRGQGSRASGCLERAAALVGGQGVVAGRRALSTGHGVGDRVCAELYDALIEGGLEVEQGVGLGDLHLDMAVRGARGKRVGIDVTGFMGIPDAMTREVYTPRFWELAGWTLVRVTPGGWLHERELILKRIHALVA